MAIGQKIYQAVEQFSVAPPNCGQFKVSLRDTLVDEGAQSEIAEHLAIKIEDAFKSQSGGDYHLGLVELIAVHPEFEKLLFQDIAATTAMHKYMSFYLGLAEVPSVGGSVQLM